MKKVWRSVLAFILISSISLQGSMQYYWTTLVRLITAHKKVSGVLGLGTVIYIGYSLLKQPQKINQRKSNPLEEQNNTAPSRLERMAEGLLCSMVSAYIGARMHNNFMQQTRNFNTHVDEIIHAYNPGDLSTFKKYIGDFNKEEKFHLDYLSNLDTIPARLRKGRKLILAGEPGTGKTAFAIEFARRSKSRLLKVSTSSLNTGWFGDGAGIVKAIFKRIREEADLHNRVVVFFDELDSIGSREAELGGSAGQSQRLTINMILEELSEPLPPNTVILAATNKIEDIDRALSRPGRFDATIKKELPDRKKRGEYWTEREKDPYYTALQEINLNTVLEDTQQFSQADMELLSDDMALRCCVQQLTPQQAYKATLNEIKKKKVLDSKKSKAQEREQREKEHLAISEEQLSYAKTHKFDPRYVLSQVWEMLNT